MLTVCVCSLFRDSIKRRDNELARYLTRIENLVAATPDVNFKFSFVEGDSTDQTFEVLFKWAEQYDPYNVIVDDLNSNKPQYGSVINAERFEVLTQAANHCIAIARDEWGDKIDYYLWLESDLIFEPDMLNNLIASIYRLKCHMLAPAIFIEPPDNRFYDTYAFVDFHFKQHFSNDPPYHPFYEPNTPVRMQSVGSVMLMHHNIIDEGCRWHKNRCILDFCDDVVEAGYHIYYDPRIVVYHPGVIIT